jgi:hypothetical protein
MHLDRRVGWPRAASGAAFQQHDYTTTGHLFADPDMPAYDATAADLMFERVVEFLKS